MKRFVKSQPDNSTPFTDKYKDRPTYLYRLEGGIGARNEMHSRSEHGKPLVSVITIVFNGEKYIEETISSVLRQTYDNIEYIVVDGGSTDGTIDILRRYNDKISYWISEPDEGIGDAFNKGIELSTGDIIGIINADDWYCADAVETVVNEYRKKGPCIYHAKLQYWSSNMKPYYVFSGDDRQIIKRGTINHPTVFVPKRIYEEIGLFNTDFRNAVDYEWLIRAKLKNQKFCYIDRILANMLLGGRSDTKWFKNYIEIFRARNLHNIGYAKNSLLFLEMVSLTACRNILEFLGLHSLIRIYRKHFSIAKKVIS